MSIMNYGIYRGLCRFFSCLTAIGMLTGIYGIISAVISAMQGADLDISACIIAATVIIFSFMHIYLRSLKWRLKNEEQYYSSGWVETPSPERTSGIINLQLASASQAAEEVVSGIAGNSKSEQSSCSELIRLYYGKKSA